MRYDQSMRVLKQIIDSGALGDIVFAQIDMHAIPHWQTFLEDYDRLTLANMSVHHLDVLRFLFGDPEEITTLTRKDPRTKFDHSDGITVSTIKFPSGVLAVSLEDVWSGPRQEGYKDDQHINWRVDGTQGVAKGTIGWPTGAASTLTYASAKTTGGEWVSPTMGHDVVPARLHRRDGATAARREDRARRRRSPSPTTSRPWRWSKRATARSTKAAPSSFPKSRSTESASQGRNIPS